MKIYSRKGDNMRNDGKGHVDLSTREGQFSWTIITQVFPYARNCCGKKHLCGTLRKNRKGNPKDVTGKKLKKGELLVKGKGQVLMISSDPVHMNSLVKSASKTRDGEHKMKPSSVNDYNAAK
ncbi:hypothetical protein J437_LFUL010117 [Ladona fulva]|uniref:PiggyBac transposable element-derived protein domain-containing protein n=1 Tax=Ladona fulva TaxID=123851 RepID=A0A8K0KJT7_LADFU|nr:hypothetical protein J437_LFUL010117 [Ladona fulva]